MQGSFQGQERGASARTLRGQEPMSRAPIEDLRRTIDCLPLRTREAMLRGIREDDIIVGAYQTRGGNCPMLAAHRRGGRTSFLSFARAWDRFAAARSPRRATARELRVLERYAPDQNPNGSLRGVAGVSDEGGNVVGLMPHPEHAIDELCGGSADGLTLFESVALARV